MTRARGHVVYRLEFFAVSGEENGQGAIDRLLNEVSSSGEPVRGERLGPFVEQVAACELATVATGGVAAADSLILEVHVGVAFNADLVIARDPNAEHEIWGCDLHAEVILSGANPDWPLVDRIWSALERLWSAAAWDQRSGFEIARRI